MDLGKKAAKDGFKAANSILFFVSDKQHAIAFGCRPE
jgi:hypothetical protein